MREFFNKKIIEDKGSNIGLLFYAFFTNKTDNPELLMEIVQWWILENGK